MFIIFFQTFIFTESFVFLIISKTQSLINHHYNIYNENCMQDKLKKLPTECKQLHHMNSCWLRNILIIDRLPGELTFIPTLPIMRKYELFSERSWKAIVFILPDTCLPIFRFKKVEEALLIPEYYCNKSYFQYDVTFSLITIHNVAAYH